MSTSTASAPAAPMSEQTSSKNGHAPAIAARRWFLVASPVLAGLFAILGAANDPAVGLDGQRLYERYAANPEPLQLKSLGFHWAYAFWMAPAMLLTPYIRGRGAWLANVAAVLGFAGIATLPGLLFIDWYDSAVGQVAGPETTAEVAQVMESMWGVPVFTLPGIVGLMLALPLVALAGWRAGVVRWWGPFAVVAGFAAFTLSGVTWWGCAITTVCFCVFAYTLARGITPTNLPRRENCDTGTGSSGPSGHSENRIDVASKDGSSRHPRRRKARNG